MEELNPTHIKYDLVGLCAVLLASFLLTTSSVMATENESREPREFFFTQSFGDLPEELQTARKQGKLGLFLFFEAEDCVYCQAMLRRVFSQKKVQDWYQERFLSIAVDIRGDVEIKDFKRRNPAFKSICQTTHDFHDPDIIFYRP